MIYHLHNWVICALAIRADDWRFSVTMWIDYAKGLRWYLMRNIETVYKILANVRNGLFRPF
jgi:hypothetical protein